MLPNAKRLCSICKASCLTKNKNCNYIIYLRFVPAKGVEDISSRPSCCLLLQYHIIWDIQLFAKSGVKCRLKGCTGWILCIICSLSEVSTFTEQIANRTYLLSTLECFQLWMTKQDPPSKRVRFV